MVVSSSIKPQLILFDVYETLLEMEIIEKKVNALLDSKRGYDYWFELFMEYCFVDNSLSTHHPFISIANSTLQMAAKFFDENVSERQIEEVIDLFQHLPLKEGVTEQLSELNDQGYRIAALTNAPQEIIESRMERTGLISYFEAVLSAEEIKKYKPAPETYNWAATKLSLSPNEILFVSSHGWDIAGAANVGMQTAYLENKRQLFYPLAGQPDFRFQNFEDLVRTLRVKDTESMS